MTLTPLIGAKAFLIFEGDATAADPGGITAETDPQTITDDEFRTLGCIASNNYQNLREGEIKTHCVGDDGVQRLRNTKHTTFERMMTIVLEDLTNDAWTLLWAVSDFDGQFVGTPGSQAKLPTGWLKVQHYDNTGDDTTANVANLQAWCEFDVNTETSFDKDNQTQMEITCNILVNGFNKVQLLNSALPDPVAP